MSHPASFTFSRVVRAPRALVYLAHTDPVHLVKWFGPAGAKVIKSDLDLSPGGIHHYGLRMPDGSEMWGKQTYVEIKSPEKLVYIQSFSNRDGEITRHPLSATWPREMLATTTFQDRGDNTTEVSITWAPHNATAEEEATFDAARAGMSGGFAGMFAQFEAYLDASASDIVSSRLINAPRERVWTALTDPAQVNRWWGPRGFKNIDVQQDVRVGGVWSYTMVGPDGTTYLNHCLYREVKAPERLVYDHGDGQTVQFLATITLEAESGKTRVILSARFPSPADRNEVLKFNAVEGGQETLAKLDEFLKAA